MKNIYIAFLFLLVSSCGGGGGSGENSSNITNQNTNNTQSLSFKFELLNSEIWKTTVTEKTPAYSYGGVDYPESLVQYNTGSVIYSDFWADGNTDVYIPLVKGYASGIDTKLTPLLFKNNGTVINILSAK